MTTVATFRTGTRATTAGAWLVVRRRAGSDAGLLILTAVVLAVTVALVLLLPRVVASAADQAVQQAVVDAGDSADLVARLGTGSGFGGSASSTRDPNVAAELRETATGVHDALPDTLRSVTGVGNVMVSTPVVRGRLGDASITTRLVYVGAPDQAHQSDLVQWVEGTAPAAAPLPEADPDSVEIPRHEVQVGMQVDAARRFGIRPGDRGQVALAVYQPVDLVVTGLYTVTSATDPAWTGATDLLAAQDAPPLATQSGHAALLLSDASLSDADLVVQPRVLVKQLRFPAQATSFDAPSMGSVTSTITQVESDAKVLNQPGAGNVSLTTSLPAALDAVAGRLAAAHAQQSVLVLGLCGVGALVLLLAATLLVTRRRPMLLVERARGASILSVVLRALLEAVPLAVVAGALGVVTAQAVATRAGWPDDDGGVRTAVALVVIAALTPAAVAALQVRTAFAGRRVPANRADRVRLARRRRTRQTVAEIALVALAVGALVSVRARGLAQTTTGDVDLLLAATPLLVAAAATLVVARALPPVLRALSRAARRRRGLVPMVATARASAAANTAVPLLTLTVAVGLVVFCGTTVITVGAGQSVAADARTGADVRVTGTEGTLSHQDVVDLRTQPGVTSAAGIAVLGSRSLGASSGTTADLVLVDADALASIESAHGRHVDGLDTLAHGEPTRPSALVSPSLSAAVALVTPQFLTNNGSVTLDVVGTVGDEPRVQSDGAGPATAGRVLLDLATFDALQHATTDPTTILVDGPGAVAAARSLADRTGVTVTSRDAWLDSWRTSPLNHDLVALLLATSAALAAYAALALVLMVAATSRERGRSLSALRTLGLDDRTASALTFAELAPVAVAAVVGGTVIGIGIPWLTSRALGLELATGGFGPPTLQVGWWPVLGALAVVGVALAVTVTVEQAVRRRDRLGEVLRVGER